MSYLLSNPGEVLTLLLQHLRMTGIALGVAIAISVPLALLVTRLRWLAVPVLGSLGVLYTIPSLALIIFLVPLFGLNATSVIVAMVLYTQVILVRNLTVGLAGINPAVLEAARGMGMSVAQRWWRVQVPLVLPVFLAGVRIAAIVAIAIATIGAKFNAGGLGKLLFDGIQTNRYDKIVAGAIAVAVLALVINGLLLALERSQRKA
ncbi:MAG: ABC transporter permease [Shackletoniella antarctica]|uniref:ABC transporter permease n=1 Tax=Shackletoniella antarctica TaxID=268115 RepID=A0A2W4VJX6_9CYAN|nr:MAG: ABC transporter permease [Shackletoniella antarctica]